MYRRPQRIYTPKDRKPRYPSRLNSDHPLSQGLVSAWPFNEGGGNTVYDTSKFHNGAFTDISWSNNQLYFSTTASKVTVTNHADLQLTGNWTYSAVVTPTSVGTRNLPIFSHWTETNAGRQIYIYIAQTVPYTGKTSVDIPFIKGIVSGTTVLADNNKYLVTVTKAGTLWTIYINGVYDNSIVDATAQEAATTDMTIGFCTRLSQYYSGYIDSPMIWNRGLSASEVASLYADPYQMFMPFPRNRYFISLVRLGGTIASGTILLANIQKLSTWLISGAIACGTALQSSISGMFKRLGGSIVSGTSLVAGLKFIWNLGGSITCGTTVSGALTQHFRWLVSGTIACGTSLIADLKILGNKLLGGIIGCGTYIYGGTLGGGGLAKVGRHFIDGIYIIVLKAKIILRIE